jgi:hypothetical protein
LLWELDIYIYIIYIYIYPTVSLESSHNSSWDLCRLIRTWINMKLHQIIRLIYIPKDEVNLYQPRKISNHSCPARDRPCLSTCVPEVRALQQNLEVGPMLRMDHGVSINGGTPIAGWFITDSPIYLMDDLGIPPF